MRVFLAGLYSRKWVFDESISRGRRPLDMGRTLHHRGGMGSGPYILESFFYADAETERQIPYMGDFMLDSGAFTFMQNSKTRVEWDGYLERYADFINRNAVEKFFELDIDSVVGYDKVIQFRKKLERLTGKQPIPVWHTNRGKDEFVKAAQEYPYVAIGGLVGTGSAEYARKYWAYFPWFIQTAHDNGAKIHALGFTSMDGMKRYHFDSVDSTAWTSGNKYGHIYRFKNGEVKRVDPPPGYHLKDIKKVAQHNFDEWVKFQKWADTHL